MTNAPLKLSQHHLRLSVPLLIVQIVVAFIVIEVASLVVLYSFSFLFGLSLSSPLALWWLAVIKSLFELGIIIKFVLDWSTVVYYIRDHQLVRFRGILEFNEAVWELRSLKTVKLHQNWIGNVFGYGNLNLVFSSSGYREDVVLRGLAHARDCEHIFRLQLEEATEKKRAIDEEVPAVGLQS